MPENKTNQRISTRDGRQLGYAEFGDPAGKPVVYCHGSPGSRLNLPNMEALIGQARVRLIAPDRPGIGLSDFKSCYQLLEWPDDIIELDDELNLDRFAILGLSGDGPFSDACAFKIPRRLTRAAIVSGIGFIDTPRASEGMSKANRRIFGLARRAKWLLRTQYWLLSRGLQGDPNRILAEMKKSLPALSWKKSRSKHRLF